MRWNIAILPLAMTLAGCVGVETMRGSGVPAAHPLDPLTAGEIDAAVAILKTAGKLPEGAFFPILVLREPPKAEVLSWKPGSSLWREAFAVVMDRPAGRTYEAVVDLASSRVLSWTPVPGVQPAVIEEEFDSVPQIVTEGSAMAGGDEEAWHRAFRQGLPGHLGSRSAACPRPRRDAPCSRDLLLPR